VPRYADGSSGFEGTPSAAAAGCALRPPATGVAGVVGSADDCPSAASTVKPVECLVPQLAIVKKMQVEPLGKHPEGGDAADAVALLVEPG